MNKSNITILASRVRGLGRELLAIANQIEAEAPHLSVNLPRDLFSDLVDIANEKPFVGDSAANLAPDDKLSAAEEETPKMRRYSRVGRAMLEHRAVESTQHLGRAQGFCNRTDIERSVVRLTGRSREDVREAVNRVAENLQIVCIKSGGYRYYNRERRREIVDKSIKMLERI